LSTIYYSSEEIFSEYVSFAIVACDHKCAVESHESFDKKLRIENHIQREMKDHFTIPISTVQLRAAPWARNNFI